MPSVHPSLIPADEARLIQQAQKGDVESFNMLVLQNQNAAYSVAYRVMNDTFAAADATQEAFISAYRALGSYRGGSFKAWLLRIVTNACYDALRHEKRRPAENIDDLPGATFDDGPPLPSDSPTPEQVAESQDVSRIIQECLQGLSDDQRITVVMFDMQGFSYQEIADTSHVELGTIKSRLSRARLGLRRCLENKREHLPDIFRL